MDSTNAYICQLGIMIKEKILCLGDNTSAEAWAHHLVENFSRENNLIFRGAVVDTNQILENGCYYTGPFSMQQKSIIEISKKFDRVVLIDQKQEQFSHSRIFLAMWKLVKDMKETGINVEILNKENMEYLDKWEKIFKKNKSICINPWVLMHDGQSGYTNLCGRNWEKIKKREDIVNWKNDSEYSKIRKKMLNGEKIIGCKGCYEFEEKGIRDMRWTDSFDWITRLKIKSVDNLEQFKAPVYFEVRPSNKCNLKCRMCGPRWSHLIQEETKSINDDKFQTLAVQHNNNEILNTNSFNLLNLDTIVRLYIAGGEPTIMPEVYEFLRNCVEQKKTNFELNINTNAVKISETLFNLFKNFSKLWFTCSIDGTPRVTEYIRWGTISKKQIENIHRLKKNGAGIHFISVISIYNVHEIGDIMEFFDNEFPYATIQLNHTDYNKRLLSAWNHPNHDLIIKSLEKAKKTRCYYHQERGAKTIVDGLYQYYSKNPTFDKETLSNFFYYNDTLDKSRGSKLKDYIPELEECRKYIK
jgi:MoaA/NifB/PqqE/SkfB family radical SAM enzyme